MWVIEDYRDAPMRPIAMFQSERFARTFARAACGDNAHVYQMELPIVLESRLDERNAIDLDAEDDGYDDASASLSRMVAGMRNRPTATPAPTPLQQAGRGLMRAAGAR